MIIGGIWSIRTLSVADKVCSLLSIGVKLIYITSCFLIPEFNLHILGVPMGSLPFVESFVLGAFQEAFDTIISLPMFANLQEAYIMLSFCYA